MTYGRLFKKFKDEFNYAPSATKCSRLPYVEAKKMVSLLYWSCKKDGMTAICEDLKDFTRTKNGVLQNKLYNALTARYNTRFN